MRVWSGLLFGVVLLAGCGKDAPREPLAFVPADTPYVFANRVPTPAAISEAWMKLGSSGNAERDVERLLQRLQAEEDVAPDADDAAFRAVMRRWLPALAPELQRFYTRAGVEELGFAFESRYAVYGHGLLPVFRAELADPAKFAAMVARVEQRAGEPLATRKFGEASFWRVAAGKVELLFGAVGGQLVVTLGPTEQSESSWQQQLGLTPPATSLEASGALAALDQQHGYTGHGSGWVDLRELVRRVTGRDAGDAAVMSAFGLPVPAPSATCLAEYDALAARAPRMHVGFSRMEDKASTMTGLWEMDPVWRDALATLPAPIPGPGPEGEGLWRYGMSIDGTALLRQLGVMARAIQTTPFACEELQPLNEMATELGANLKNPALGMAGAVNALQFTLDGFQLGEDGTPEQLNAVFAVGGSMPPMLWSMLQGSVPALAEVTLAADGKPVTLPESLWPLPIPLQALMTGNSLAVAAGEIGESRFLSEATRPAAADGTLVYYRFSGSMFAQLGGLMRKLDAQKETPEPEVAETAELLEQMGSQVGDMRVQLRADAGGLRMEQSMRLN